MQVEPLAHTAHAAPPVPHAAALVPAWQRLFWQQPLAHEAPLHTHWPITHC